MLEEAGVCKAWANEAASDAQETKGGCDGRSTDGDEALVGLGPHHTCVPRQRAVGEH